MKKMEERNKTTTKTTRLIITSSIVWDNPKTYVSGSSYYQEYQAKKGAIGCAELMGHHYVLKIVLAQIYPIIRDNCVYARFSETYYVASDYETFEELQENKN